jgi:HAD superfamily hydrolase (TIGR01484 family)
MKYKALICDVDGTLIPNKLSGMPSQKVIQAVNNASKKIAVGIATARSYWQIAHILDILSLSSPCIITGGAQIINPTTRRTFLEKTIKPKDIHTIASIAHEMDISIIVSDREGEKVYKKDAVSEKPLDLYTSPISLDTADLFMKKIAHIKSISSHKALAWEHTTDVVVTIVHPKASKQDAILRIAKMLGIKTNEIIGVGEGYNDVPFLMSCGLKVAMGNAVEEVKAIADYIAPSVAEDGVFHIIQKFIL